MALPFGCRFRGAIFAAQRSSPAGGAAARTIAGGRFTARSLTLGRAFAESARGRWRRRAFGLAPRTTLSISVATSAETATAATTAAKAAAAATTAIALAAAFAATPLVERTPIATTLAVARRRAFLSGVTLVPVFTRLEQGAMRQVDAAHAIDLGDQDLDLVADVDDILDAGHSMVRQL